MVVYNRLDCNYCNFMLKDDDAEIIARKIIAHVIEHHMIMMTRLMFKASFEKEIE